MKKKFLSIAIICLLIFGCTPESEKIETAPKIKQNSKIKSYEPFFDRSELSEELRFHYMIGYNPKEIGLTYSYEEPMQLPSGKIISNGDLKPTWQYFQEQLKINIKDVTEYDKNVRDIMGEGIKNNFSNADIFGGRAANYYMDLGSQGYFVNLKEHLKEMPYFTDYLDKNPNVAKSITSYDGGIYHIPKVAEIENYAMMFLLREDWLKALLDSESYLVDENETLNIAYNGYWKGNFDNIITLQNNISDSGILTRDNALKTLKDYIKKKYPEFSKPSDLYLGDTAIYDIDELTALWRVVKLSPNTLTKLTTGNAIDGAKIVPFFLRSSSFKDRILHLVTYFDGLKCNASGVTGTGVNFFNNEGEMIYTYAEDNFLDKLQYLKSWYTEGLIYSEFHNNANKDDFKKNLFFSDDEIDKKEFGFMTYDFISSTTGGNENISVILPPMTTITNAGIEKPVHYMESTRTISNAGWAISSATDEKSLNSALTLFDYIFSPEGYIAQNYAIPELLSKNRDYKAINGRNYPKFDQWVLDSADRLTYGDVTSFQVNYLGSAFIIGFSADIGVEIQRFSENGLKGWELYTNKVLSPTYESPHNYLRIMPPIIPLTNEEQEKLNSVNIGNLQLNLIYRIITGSLDKESEFIKENFISNGLSTYLEVYKNAYIRMMEDR